MSQAGPGKDSKNGKRARGKKKTARQKDLMSDLRLELDALRRAVGEKGRRQKSSFKPRRARRKTRADPALDKVAMIKSQQQDPYNGNLVKDQRERAVVNNSRFRFDDWRDIDVDSSNHWGVDWRATSSRGGRRMTEKPDKGGRRLVGKIAGIPVDLEPHDRLILTKTGSELLRTSRDVSVSERGHIQPATHAGRKLWAKGNDSNAQKISLSSATTVHHGTAKVVPHPSQLMNLCHAEELMVPVDDTCEFVPITVEYSAMIPALTKYTSDVSSGIFTFIVTTNLQEPFAYGSSFTSVASGSTPGSFTLTGVEGSSFSSDITTMESSYDRYVPIGVGIEVDIFRYTPMTAAECPGIMLGILDEFVTDNSATTSTILSEDYQNDFSLSASTLDTRGLVQGDVLFKDGGLINHLEFNLFADPQNWSVNLAPGHTIANTYALGGSVQGLQLYFSDMYTSSKIKIRLRMHGMLAGPAQFSTVFGNSMFDPISPEWLTTMFREVVNAFTGAVGDQNSVMQKLTDVVSDSCLETGWDKQKVTEILIHGATTSIMGFLMA